MCIRDRASLYDVHCLLPIWAISDVISIEFQVIAGHEAEAFVILYICLLYTSDAADERSSVDLGGRRIIKKKNKEKTIQAPINT